MKLNEQMVNEIWSYAPDHAPKWLEVMDELREYFYLKWVCEKMILDMMVEVITIAINEYEDDED